MGKSKADVEKLCGGVFLVGLFVSFFLYPWTKHCYFFRGDNAIWLDNELCRGHSGPTETFGNEQLTETQDFLCARVEVFGFVPESWSVLRTSIAC